MYVCMYVWMYSWHEGTQQTTPSPQSVTDLLGLRRPRRRRRGRGRGRGRPVGWRCTCAGQVGRAFGTKIGGVTFYGDLNPPFLGIFVFLLDFIHHLDLVTFCIWNNQTGICCRNISFFKASKCAFCCQGRLDVSNKNGGFEPRVTWTQLSKRTNPC